MASYFKILNVTYNCEKECPCRPENKLSTELSSPKDQGFIHPAPKKVRFTVVPVSESKSKSVTFALSDNSSSGWF